MRSAASQLIFMLYMQPTFPQLYHSFVVWCSKWAICHDCMGKDDDAAVDFMHLQAIAQSISEVWFSDDVTWMGRVRLQFDAQAAHNTLNVVIRVVILGAPYTLYQQASSQYAANISGQLCQKRVLYRGKRDDTVRD